jgi:hypothetical protein
VRCGCRCRKVWLTRIDYYYYYYYDCQPHAKIANSNWLAAQMLDTTTRAKQEMQRVLSKLLANRCGISICNSNQSQDFHLVDQTGALATRSCTCQERKDRAPNALSTTQSEGLHQQPREHTHLQSHLLVHTQFMHTLAGHQLYSPAFCSQAVPVYFIHCEAMHPPHGCMEWYISRQCTYQPPHFSTSFNTAPYAYII